MDARAALIAFALGAIALTPFTANAQQPVGLDWIAREPGVEIAVSAAALSVHSIGLIDQRDSGWGPAWKRRRDDGYGLASDFTGALLGTTWQMAASYAIDVEYFSARGAAEPAEEAGRTTLVDLQAVVLATGISTALKRLTGRCRPRAVHGYGCGEHNAFPSGHTVMPSALAGARFMLAARTGDSAERWGAFGMVESMALTTAALRMLAGAHSWEDVLGGWLIGHATGTLLSLAHPERTVATDTAAPAASASRFVWSSRF